MITKLECIDLLDRKNFNTKSLKIFKNLFKNTFEIDKNVFNNTLLNWIKNNNLSAPGCKLHPNLLRYIYINLNLPLVCNINPKNKTTFCYINLNNEKKKIRTQDYFSYTLIYDLKNKLRRKKKKDPIYKEIYKQLFCYCPYLKITKFLGVIENNRFINTPNPKRTDLEIKLFNNKISIVIEFLEIRSHCDFNQYEIDEFRLYKITKNNYDIKATWLILEKTLIKKGEIIFFDNLVNKLLKLVTNLYLLEDEETFITGNLELITKNKKFSKMLYKSHKSITDFSISKNSIDNFINNWKNKNSKFEYGKFFQNLVQNQDNNISEEDIILELNDLDINDLDDDVDENIINNEDSPFFICDINNNIEFFSFEGFNQYILNLESKFLKNSYEKLRISKLYTKITKGLLDIFKERYDRLKNSTDNSFFIY
jgi:hypothetical protein